MQQLKAYHLDTTVITTKAQNQGIYARMLVFEKDGTYSNFCGNGAKLLAYVYRDILKKEKQIGIENIHGTVIRIIGQNNHFQIQLPVKRMKVKKEKENTIKNIFQLETNRLFSLFEAADEPHLVIDLSLKKVPDFKKLYSSCMEIQELFPFGVNVDVITNEKVDTIVFERGVNNFTKSCGTGSVCVATFLHHQDKVVSFITEDGDTNKLCVKNTSKYYPSLSGKIHAVKLFDHSVSDINLSLIQSLSVMGGAT